jgi:hypothetical protein
MVGQPVQEGGSHFCVAEHVCPFAEAEVVGDDDAGALVEFTQQVEQQRAAGRAERQIAQFIEDNEVEAQEAFCKLACLVGLNALSGLRNTVAIRRTNI